MATTNGTIGDDTLSGTDDNDILNGLAGNDTLDGGIGDDTLDGGSASDLLQGGYGSDTYIVDNLGDLIVETNDGGGYGDDDSVYSSVTWTLDNYLENLTLTGNNAISGTGNTLSNILSGNEADNSLFGGDGDDYLWGGSGGIDTLNGGAGNDTYDVDADDIINEEPNAGIDTVDSIASWTLGANLENLGLDGYNAINGTGNELNNNIRGNFGANTLFGGAGNDWLNGIDGNDRLVGGRGNDTLTGGAGADRFIRKYSTTAIDTITDFQVGVDLLAFSASGFGGGLAGGAVLNETQFTIGSAAADSSDRFIYNSATGALFFDADGIGGAAQVKIFTLSSGLAMTNADIFIFA